MFRLFLPLLPILALTGCVGGTSPATQFYVLKPAPAASEYPVLQVPTDLSIGLGPIQLPPMLERPQIVTRIQGHSVVLGEFDRWVGNLKENMARIMARQLMRQLNTSRVALHPWPRHRELDLQVRLDILRFDGTLGGTTELSGTWTLVDGSGMKELRTEAFNMTHATAGPEYEDLVASMGQTTAELTNQIGAAIGQHFASGK